MPRLIRYFVACFALFYSTQVLGADVDTSPLRVQIVPAFPDLQWPDWMTGADEGNANEPEDDSQQR